MWPSLVVPACGGECWIPVPLAPPAPKQTSLLSSRVPLIWASGGVVFTRALDLPNGCAGLCLLRWADFLRSLCTFVVWYRASESRIFEPLFPAEFEVLSLRRQAQPNFPLQVEQMTYEVFIRTPSVLSRICSGLRSGVSSSSQKIH
jgi:hypothetical protein